MPDSPDSQRSSPPGAARSAAGARAWGAAGKTLRLVLLVLGVAYMLLQGLSLVFPFKESVLAMQQGSNRAFASASGELLGGIAGFWMGAIYSLVLLRSLLSPEGEGPRRRGRAFLGLFLLALVLCLAGGSAVLFGTVAADTKRPSDVDTAIRAGGVILLICGALAVVMAFGRSRRSRVKAILVEDDANGDE